MNGSVPRELQTALPVGSFAGILNVNFMGSDSFFFFFFLKLFMNVTVCMCCTPETWMISPLPFAACLLFCLTQSITRLVHSFASSRKAHLELLSFFSLTQSVETAACTLRLTARSPGGCIRLDVNIVILWYYFYLLVVVLPQLLEL